MAATRFPDKPLAKINGMPMIGHVYYRSKMCKNISDLYVATCDKEIFDYVKSIGGKSVMTKDTHQRASDRTSEAYEKIIELENSKFDSILMIQGDEPLLNPELLDKMISFYNDQKSPFITNLISKINHPSDKNNNNVVKVVTGEKNKILYFSRSLIPSNSKFKGEVSFWKQLGLILFSKTALRKFVSLKPTTLEIIESVDMNRIIENNLTITAFKTDEQSKAVDIPSDLIQIEKLFIKDKYIKYYLN